VCVLHVYMCAYAYVCVCVRMCDGVCVYVIVHVSVISDEHSTLTDATLYDTHHTTHTYTTLRYTTPHYVTLHFT
jgi:hypothetical protein